MSRARPSSHRCLGVWAAVTGESRAWHCWSSAAAPGPPAELTDNVGERWNDLPPARRRTAAGGGRSRPGFFPCLVGWERKASAASVRVSRLSRRTRRAEPTCSTRAPPGSMFARVPTACLTRRPDPRTARSGANYLLALPAGDALAANVRSLVPQVAEPAAAPPKKPKSLAESVGLKRKPLEIKCDAHVPYSWLEVCCGQGGLSHALHKNHWWGKLAGHMHLFDIKRDAAPWVDEYTKGCRPTNRRG